MTAIPRLFYVLLQRAYSALARSQPVIGEVGTLMKETLFQPYPEAVEASLLREALRPGDVVVEVGARSGGSTLLISALVEGGTVIALEPNPYIVKSLSRRVGGLKNVHVVGAAASDKDGQADFSIGGVDDVGASLVRNRGWKSVSVRTVRVDTLSSRLDLARVDGLVIDAEGSEGLVIMGAMTSLRSSRFVLVEIHHFLDSHLEVEVTGLLASIGFEKAVSRVARVSPLTTVDLYLKRSL